MRLLYKKPFISITQFNIVDLPNFVVLTGVNGAGKSHLLEAIENKSVVIANHEDAKVVRFDYKNFFLENESAYNARQIVEERNNAWTFLQNTVKGQVESFRNNLGPNYARLVEISARNGKSLFDLSSEDVQDQELLTQLTQYRTSLRSFFNQESFRNNQQALAIFPVAYALSVSLDEVSRDEFDELYKPYQFKNDFLPNQLGKVIWDYYIKFRANEVNEFHNQKYGKTYPVVSEADFVKIHGKKPWDVINSILESFGTIQYRLPSPEGSDYYSDFQFRLEHPSKGLHIDFSALSSGEKVLMALVASIYKASSDHHFPDVLLLDEIDASLHPSMIKNLLDTINEIFLKNGTKVVLVTHSPTTVALTDEQSVYVMNKEGEERIVKKTRGDALSILTEGFATLEEGLRVFDEISKQDISIISEGRNASLIQKALELYGIADVDVITGVEGVSGSTQLRTLFEFLSKVPHQKKVIVVWDPEVQNGLLDVNNTYPFIFPKNSNNSLVDRGIENLFGESLFEGFVTTVNDSYGKERKAFDSNRKKDFTEHILNRNTKTDFVNFESLVNKINELRVGA